MIRNLSRKIHFNVLDSVANTCRIEMMSLHRPGGVHNMVLSGGAYRLGLLYDYYAIDNELKDEIHICPMTYVLVSKISPGRVLCMWCNC
jgi:hypothetical protein